MQLTNKQAKKLSGMGIWVDYYRGYPSIPDIMSNNWCKIHGLPLIRRREIRNAKHNEKENSQNV